MRVDPSLRTLCSEPLCMRSQKLLTFNSLRSPKEDNLTTVERTKHATEFILLLSPTHVSLYQRFHVDHYNYTKSSIDHNYNNNFNHYLSQLVTLIIKELSDWFCLPRNCHCWLSSRYCRMLTVIVHSIHTLSTCVAWPRLTLQN